MKLPPDGYSSSGGSSSGSNSSEDSGSSSSSRSADDDADVAPTTAAPNAPVKAAKLKDLGSRGDMSAARAKLEQTRVADDLKIAKFYWNDGNTQGAYLRYKDAVDHAPDDPDARFGLAEAASKLKKNDEAILNYREYLKADPDGDHDKDARRALAKLGAPSQ
jgi:tetratricopeptide (TPR) repeat protein